MPQRSSTGSSSAAQVTEAVIDAAIVGLGRWGRRIVSSVQGRSERLRFVRAMVPHPDKAREFSIEHDLDLSANYADVLADPRVQAVVLATPHSQHVEQIVAAARAGKAVHCEKPLALTRADALRAVKACREADVVLGVGHDKRYFPSMRELERIVKSGELGTILHAEANSSNEVSLQHYAPWREAESEAPGLSLTATGVHLIDALANLVGPVTRVQAQSMIHQPAPGPVDTLTLLLEFRNRATGTLCSVRPTPFFWRVHVFGTKGSAEAIGETELVLRMSGCKPDRRTFEPADTVRTALDIFADAVSGRAAYPMSSEHIVETIAAFEAATTAVAHNASVRLDKA
jgi:predicted dehydrogenase